MPEAGEWARKAAVVGHTTSMLILAKDLIRGDRMEIEEATGWRWIEEAAQTGDELAKMWLGDRKAAYQGSGAGECRTRSREVAGRDPSRALGSGKALGHRVSAL
jgi:TPR repeat protein